MKYFSLLDILKNEHFERKFFLKIRKNLSLVRNPGKSRQTPEIIFTGLKLGRINPEKSGRFCQSLLKTKKIPIVKKLIKPQQIFPSSSALSLQFHQNRLTEALGCHEEKNRYVQHFPLKEKIFKFNEIKKNLK